MINDQWEQYYKSKKEEWREELAAMKRRYRKIKETVTILNKKLQDSQRLVTEHTLRVVSQPEQFCEATHKQVIECAKVTLFHCYKFMVAERSFWISQYGTHLATSL